LLSAAAMAGPTGMETSTVRASSGIATPYALRFYQRNYCA
jgi:hypothetical protein